VIQIRPQAARPLMRSKAEVERHHDMDRAGSLLPCADRRLPHWSHFILAPSSSSVHELSIVIFCLIILNGTQTVPLQHSHPIQG
jgi:hypothetical protein